MNRKLFFLAAVIAAVWLITPSPVFAQDGSGDKVIFSGNFTLKEGEVLQGDLVVFAGVVKLEKGTTVTGDVAIIGGNLSAGGTILGNLVGLGGDLRLNEGAVVRGDLTVIGSSLERSAEAEVQGSMMTSEEFPLRFDRDWLRHRFEINKTGIKNPLSPIMSLIWFTFRVFIWAGLAALVFLFLDEPIIQISRTAFDQPGISFLSGFGVAVLAPVLLIVLLITILLSPVSLLGFLILGAAWILGWIALGYEIGTRLASGLNQTWSPLIRTTGGTFLVMLILNGFNQIFPFCIGWMPKTFFGFWMLGAVVLTRFGSRSYPASTSLSDTSEIHVEGESAHDQLTPNG